MAVTITHTTPADGTFSATGAAAWDANHAVSGLGTMAEQDANNVNITGGSITGVTGVITTLTANSTPTSGFSAGQFLTSDGTKLQATSLGTIATQNANSVAITGGNIDGTAIGATTQSSAKFTTLNASSTLTFGNYTGYLYANGAGAVTAAATIPNSGLTNSSVTINGTSISLGGSATISASTTGTLTLGTGLSGTSFNGSTNVTAAIANTTVVAAAYGSASAVATFTVNAQGQLTAAANATISIAASQINTTIPISGGGTGQTTASAAFNALSPITSTGDLIIGNGTNSATRLAIGSNNTVLTSNGTTASWAALPANVSSLSFGTTGLTPNTATTGAITVAGTLVAANGGTGQSSYTIGDLLYASGTTALSKLADVAVGAVLTSGGVGVAPAWSSSPTISNLTISGDTVLGSTIGDSTTLPNQSELQYTTSGFSTEMPDLNLDFTNNDFLDSRITFSRTSNATLINSIGKLTYAPNNLATYSEQFDNAAWTKTRSSITANTTVAPDGTYTADKLVEDSTATNSHFTQQSYTGTAGVNYIFSVYLKASERTNAAIRLSTTGGTATGFTAVFNLSTGVVSTTSNTATPLNTYAAVTSVGNGWYRCYIGMTLISTATALIAQVAASDSSTPTFTSGLPSYTGNGSSGIFVWGAQVESVTYQNTPSTYVRTVASAYYGPRFDYDPVTLAPKGLLIEEARTNLLTYSTALNTSPDWFPSDSSVVVNSIVSPDGTVNGVKLLDTTANAAHFLQTTYAGAVTGTAYTATMYAKQAERSWAFITSFGAGFGGVAARAFFNLATGTIGTVSAGVTATITNVGNGWYRCSITRSTSATASITLGFCMSTADNTITYVGNGTSGIFIWGPQLEAGSFATSYIPTGAASVARTADNASMTGTNFSSWFNQGPVNLLLQSQTFDNASWTKLNVNVTADAGVAPDGTTTADKIIPTTTSSANHVIYQSVSSSTTATFSVRAKADGYSKIMLYTSSPAFYVGFDLAAGTIFTPTGVSGTVGFATITDLGSGWYQCTMVATSINTNAQIYVLDTTAYSAYAGDGTSGVLLWGAQLEVGQIATPYAVTTTAPASLQPAEGSLFVAWQQTAPSVSGKFYNVATLFLDSSNRVNMYVSGTAMIPTVTSRSSNVQDFANTFAAISANSQNKIGVAFATNNTIAGCNGASGVLDTSVILPAVNTMYIGSDGSTAPVNGYLQYIRYYAKRLSDTIVRGSSAL